MLNTARRLTAEDPITYPRDEGPLDAYSRALTTVVDRVGPAVVRVESVADGRRLGGVGSDLIIAGEGLVLTNSHVVGGAKRVRLSIAEGGEAEAQLLGDDPDTHLALLRSELPSGTPAAALGDSKALRRGQLDLLLKNRLWNSAVVATLVVTVACYLLAQPVPGIGITIPSLVTPFIAAMVALLVARTNVAAVAYVSGSLGILIGADLLNLGRIQGLGDF
jgi:hypothetical protein